MSLLNSIVMIIIIIFILCRNILILIRAIRISAAIKRGQCDRCAAVIITERGRINLNVLLSTSYAKAQYTIKNESVIGVMLAPVYERLSVNQEREVLVDRRFPRVFALSEKHARNTLVKYLVFCIFFGATLLALLALLFELCSR